MYVYRSDEACELVQEIAQAFSHDQLMWRYREQLKGESVSLFPDSPASKIAKWVQDMQERVGRDVLSAEQAERLLRMLLERLLYDKNWLSRYHVAQALSYLIANYDHGIWSWEDWGGFWIVEDAVQALMWTLKHDESFWVRGAAARSLVQMQYRVVVEPLTELYRWAVADRLAKMQSGEVAELPPGFCEFPADQHLEPALRDLLEAYEYRRTLQGFTEEDAELVRRCLQDAQSGFEDTKSDD